MLYVTQLPSPMGPLHLAGSDEGLAGLWMEGQKYFAAGLPAAPPRRDDLPVFVQVRRWLGDYFAGRRPAPGALPLCPAGSPFRQEVWRLLCQIPYGHTTTYGQLAGQVARRLGRASMSSQAVGGAVGHNPISIIIPCHRVVGAGGSLTGYAGGINKKVALLRHERVDCSRFTVPERGTAL